MTFTSKITALKKMMNSTYSSFVSTLTETYDGDYCDSIVYALRLLGKQARIYVKTLWIPIKPNTRYFDITSASYSKEAVDYVKAHELALAAPSIANGVVSLNLVPQVATTIEDIEKTEFVSGTNKVAQKNVMSSTALKFNAPYVYPSTAPTYKGMGPIKTATSNVPTNKCTLLIPTSYFVAAPVAADIVVNLDKTDNSVNYIFGIIDSISTIGNDYSIILTTDNVLTTGNYKWVAGDFITISTGYQSFYLLTIQAIPKLAYLTASGDLSNAIPVMPQFEDDVDHLCLKYLFRMLAMRDPEKMNIYTGMLKTGLLKSELEVIRDVKIRANTVDLINAGNYTPISNPYGR